MLLYVNKEVGKSVRFLTLVGPVSKMTHNASNLTFRHLPGAVVRMVVQQV